MKKENLPYRKRFGASPKASSISYIWTMILVGIVIFLSHRVAEPGYRDDAIFATVLDHVDLVEFLTDRYLTWSSRILTDGVMVILAHAPFGLWMILDTLVILLLIASVRTLLGMPKSAGSVLITTLLFAFVPFGTLSTAGYIATSVNYLWPLAFGTYAMIPLRRLLYREKIHAPEYLAYFFAAIYAANMELAAALLLGFYFLGIIAVIYRNRNGRRPDIRHLKDFLDRSDVQNLCMVIMVIALLSVLFHLSCPGNAERYAQEVTTWYPEYATFGFAKKLELGLLTTLPFYVTGTYQQMIFPVLTGLLMLRGFSEKRALPVRLMATLTFVGSLLVGFPLRYLVGEGLIWHHSQYYDLLANIYPSGHEYCLYAPRQVGLEVALYLLLILWMLAEIILILGRTGEAVAVVISFGGALAAHLIMGFSPTVYLSGSRAGLFTTAILLMIGIRLLSKLQGSCKYVTIGVLLILATVSVYFAWAIVPAELM